MSCAICRDGLHCAVCTLQCAVFNVHAAVRTVLCSQWPIVVLAMSSVSSVPRQNCRRECMCRGRCIEGRNDVVADEKFPQGPSFPALGHKQGPEGAWETLWHCTCNSILCVLALYLNWVFKLCSVCTKWYSKLVQLHCYLRFLLCILWPVNQRHKK